MIRLGLATWTDLLGCIAVLALSLKVVATATLLAVDGQVRDRPGWGAALWWTTKLTPVLAVGCLLWLTLLERDAAMLRFGAVAAAFVVVAVPLKVRQRRNRIARQGRAGLPARR